MCSCGTIGFNLNVQEVGPLLETGLELVRIPDFCSI